MTAKEKLTALADAVREKTGKTEPLSLDSMTAAIKALDASGTIPSGFAAGQFNSTASTISGGFRISHSLDKVPDIVIIYKEDPALVGQSVRAVMRVNCGEELDLDFGNEVGEEGYVAQTCAQRIFYDNIAGTDVSSVAGTDGWDSRETIEVPSLLQAYYMPHLTYRWIAISLS